MEKENTTKNKKAKIIVSSEDELTDLLRKISGLEDSNILLTFAEESDLLISPINLKVLQEVCDELDKNLVLQIIQNPNGIRNAKIADSVTTNSPSEIDEALWLAAENQKKERKDKLEKALKGTPKETREAIENLAKEETPVLQDSEYQKRVQEVIEKAKNLANKEKSQVIKEDDFVFAVGEEINTEEKKEGAKPEALIGKNFNNMTELKDLNEGKQKKEEGKKAKKEKPPVDKKKRKKKLIVFSILAFASLIVAGVFAYFTLPLVQAEIHIESRAIEVEKIFKGDTDIQNFNIGAGEIPIRREEVKVSRSDDRTTTGEGERGSKAEGIVNVKKYIDEELEIPSGTKITVDDLQFEFLTDVLIPEGPRTTEGVAVRATEPGSRHNLSAGQIFTIEGYSDIQNISAENQSSFSGGASETYPMLTQGDYNTLLESLKNKAFEDGKKQLEERLPDWELIEGTIQQDLDGSPRTDIPVDGEGSMFNMSIETTTQALFFKKSEILEAREEIIQKAAIENNLFDSDEDIDLELDPEIETEIIIEEIDGNNVTIKFTAKGNVRPRVNTEEIEKSLLGKSWEEGLKILEEIKFSEEKPNVKFSPEYFPVFLRYFPNREGRVIVDTKLIETEVVTEIDEEGGEDEEEEEEEND